MRSMITILAAAMLLSFTATAELQNVEIDGQLLIRGNYQMMADWEDDRTWIEQRTLLGVRADFTDDVSAYIQFDNYSVWGEDFRSMSWESGYDDRATIDEGVLDRKSEDGMAEVEVYQAYIEANDMWGTMLDLRIGRQELIFGDEFLLGNNSTGYFAFGLSFDAIRVDYETDMFTITGVAAKLNEEVFGDLFDEDENLYMIYGSYTGMENLVIDLYAMYTVDEESGEDDENLTIGLYSAGAFGAIDYALNAAYQDQNDGDDMHDDEFFAADLEVGYTLDTAWMPRLFATGAYISNDFDRLFSDKQIIVIRDDRNRNEQNVWNAGGGVEVQPTECISASLCAKYIEEDNDPVGVEAILGGTYSYSEDLDFSLLYVHLFADDDYFDGDDQDLISFITSISF